MPYFKSSIKNYCRKRAFSSRDDYEVYLPFCKSLAVYSDKMAFPFIMNPVYPLCKENKGQLYCEVTLLNLCYHHRFSGNNPMSGKQSPDCRTEKKDTSSPRLPNPPSQEMPVFTHSSESSGTECSLKGADTTIHP